MANRNSYLTYKRDTSRIIYWVVQTSNAIIKSLRAKADAVDDVPAEPNLSGGVTVAGLVALAKLISRHIDSTPPAILRLFQSVIAARSATYSTFQQFAARNPDPDVLKSNASHKLFIDALVVAFRALGGEAAIDSANKAESRTDTGTDALATPTESKDDLDQLLLANKFGALDLEGTCEPEPESEEETAPATSAPVRRKQAKPGKGKKGKRARKPKKADVEEPKLEDVPLESYRIIQDTEGVVTDYLMAVYDLLQQMMKLRGKMQEIWREVAYDGLNSAVAGAVSHIAVGMVRRTAAAMFCDFPGHDSFETVMDTITRGDVEKSQGMFTMSLFRQDYGGAEKVIETKVDVKEHFLVHAYRDLLDFILDFQKTRSGKPTKRMLAEIKNWDPNFNLERATNDDRVKWRRAYTINWLYDLANVYSGVVVQRNNVKKEGHVLEKVDWSPNGPWGMHRVIYGLQDFASFVTTLAMQLPGTDVRNRILPHHVFQLQCITDSLAVSRGWSLSVLRGHVIVPPARGFRPRRDVDLFMDRDCKRTAHGYPQGAHVLEQLLEKEVKQMWGPTAKGIKDVIEMTELMRLDFQEWFGVSKYKFGLNTIPPSRFSNTDSNGLWEYSPMLCGVGLAEALQLAYVHGMWLWDQLPEVTYMVHLHNMLHQRGFIKRPVGLYASLEEIFTDSFFDGKVPTSDFADALHRHIKGVNESLRSRMRESKSVARNKESSIHELLGVELNVFFTVKSQLILYYKANWDPDRIPDADLPVASALAGVRLSQTRRIVAPKTGKLTFQETDLVRRMKEKTGRNSGSEDVMLDSLMNIFDQAAEQVGPAGPFSDEHLPEAVRQQLLQQFPDYKIGSPEQKRKPDRGRQGQHMFAGHELQDDALLDLYKIDIMRDVCGVAPLSSFNYVWGAAGMVLTFLQIEKVLQKGGFSLYRDAYESGAPELGTLAQKRFALVHHACNSTDTEALRAMARVFEEGRVGFMAHIYWEDMLEDIELPKTTTRKEQESMMSSEPDMCSVM